MATNRVTTKVAVGFELELDITDLDKLKKDFEKATPGSAKREAIYDLIKARHRQATARFEGEVLAHSNIAKKKLDDLFKL